MAGKTVEENKRAKLYGIIKEVLGIGYVKLFAEKLVSTENIKDNIAQIKCSFYETCNKKKSVKKLNSTGRGLIDALFGGLLEHYSESYRSLKNITFVGFAIKPDFETSETSGSDASVEVVIEFLNSSRKIMTFRSKNRSVVSASVESIFAAIEFYINSELAFRRLKFLILDAKERDRGDLLSLYKYQISAIVSVTSYEGVL